MANLNRYAEIILGMEISASRRNFPAALRMETEGDLEVYYAPFDYVNVKAKICICGITPGLQQAVLAINRVREELLSGSNHDDALKSAKEIASFSGTMRDNLIAMLEMIGVSKLLDVESCADLFGKQSDLVHYTSALRYPVIHKGRNYSGTPNMLFEPFLLKQIELYLKEEIGLLPEKCLYVPLGPRVSDVFSHLSGHGILSPTRVLDGLPHPSGLNSERISYFLGKKDKNSLSSRTSATKIDAAKAEILQKISESYPLDLFIKPILTAKNPR
jgi:hypothetical protein